MLTNLHVHCQIFGLVLKILKFIAHSKWYFFFFFFLAMFDNWIKSKRVGLTNGVQLKQREIKLGEDVLIRCCQNKLASR
jgi:hypothetical protein